MSGRDPWDHAGNNHAVALIISNQYRARHGMEPLDVHAMVDEDIAEAVVTSDWLAARDADRWDEGALWAYEEITGEKPGTFLAPGDNPYRTTRDDEERGEG